MPQLDKRYRAGDLPPGSVVRASWRSEYVIGRTRLCALDEIEDDGTGLPCEDTQKFWDLCSELGITPVEPDTLRWYSRENNPTLIREDTFEEYAQEFAEDVHGDGVREMGLYIDWERFADGLRMDYYNIEYDGHTWLRRA